MKTDKTTITEGASGQQNRAQWEAERLRSGRYVIRPVGSLGTCGSWPCLWTAKIVSQRNVAKTLSQLNAI